MTLTGTGTLGLGVVVEPASVTEQVVPGNPETRFGFTVSVSFQAAGDETVVWTATIDALACLLVGKEEVAVYDGSMSEWVRDESLPMTLGTEPG